MTAFRRSEETRSLPRRRLRIDTSIIWFCFQTHCLIFFHYSSSCTWSVAGELVYKTTSESAGERHIPLIIILIQTGINIYMNIIAINLRARPPLSIFAVARLILKSSDVCTRIFVFFRHLENLFSALRTCRLARCSASTSIEHLIIFFVRNVQLGDQITFHFPHVLV